MLRHVSKVFFPCSLLSFTLSVHAEKEVDLVEVIVTANRTEKLVSTIPNTVTVINQTELNTQIAINPDLSTILGNLVPSFSPSRQKLTGYGESMRGRSPLYLVDGVPQSNPLRDGSRDGHTIDPTMLERIEVIHGANAIHGMGASGGIINLITKRPTEDFTQNLRVETFAQTEDVGESLGYGLNYSISGRKDSVDAMGAISYRTSGVAYDANGEVIGFDNTQGDTMDSDMLNFFIKTGYEWNDQRIELSINSFDIAGNNDWLAVPGSVSEGIPTTAVKGDVEGKPSSNEVTMFNINYSNEEIFGQNLRFQLFSQDFAGTYGGGIYATFQDPAYGEDVFDQSRNNSEKLGMKLTLVKDEVAGTSLNVVYGLDVLRDETNQELVQTGRAWVPPTKYKNYAPFLQLEYTGIKSLILTGGVRHEESALQVNDFTTLYSYNGGQFVVGGETEFSDTLYNLGATFDLTENWRLFGNLSEGFSMPDVGRVLRSINEPDLEIESFLNLKPIVTENAELGFEYRSDPLYAQLSYYQSNSDFGQRLQVDADGIYSVEREKTEIDGFEFRTEWDASVNNFIGLRYAYTDGQFDSNDDGRVDTDLSGANMSPNKVNISWDYQWLADVSSRVQANYHFDREFKDSEGNVGEEDKFEGYLTLDASVKLATLGGEFRLSLQNLTNEDYFTYYSQTIGSDGRNFKGLGRSFLISYQIGF